MGGVILPRPTLRQSIRTFIHSEMERQHIPGLSLLVAREGNIVRAQGYGLANVELQVPVQPETIFQSGSVGKQFTATAVMMLVEEGRIKLDDPITKYLKGAPASWKQVTVRELLSHTAGFTDYPEKFDFRKDYTEKDLLKIVEGIPLAFARCHAGRTLRDEEVLPAAARRRGVGRCETDCWHGIPFHHAFTFR